MKFTGNFKDLIPKHGYEYCVCDCRAYYVKKLNPITSIWVKVKGREIDFGAWNHTDNILEFLKPRVQAAKDIGKKVMSFYKHFPSGKVVEDKFDYDSNFESYDGTHTQWSKDSLKYEFETMPNDNYTKELIMIEDLEWFLNEIKTINKC